MKEPSSFKLFHFYYNNADEIVFETIDKNNYVCNVTNYYDYKYDNDDKKFSEYIYLNSSEEKELILWILAVN